MSSPSNGSTETDYVVLVFLVVIAIMRNRSLRANRDFVLQKGERLRPITITLLDPVISIFLIGGVLWDLMTRSDGHFVAALVGAAIGIPIGMARARVQYVRAVGTAKSVVFRRSPMEYGLLGLLLVLRIAESSITNLHNGFATYAIAAGAALAVAESIARSAAIAIRYHRETTLAP
jgi:hypothetical protein